MMRRISVPMWSMVGVAALNLVFATAAAMADGSLNSALTRGLHGGLKSAGTSPFPVTVYTAKKILTMERSNAKLRP